MKADALEGKRLVCGKCLTPMRVDDVIDRDVTLVIPCEHPQATANKLTAPYSAAWSRWITHHEG